MVMEMRLSLKKCLPLVLFIFSCFHLSAQVDTAAVDSKKTLVGEPAAMTMAAGPARGALEIQISPLQNVEDWTTVAEGETRTLRIATNAGAAKVRFSLLEGEEFGAEIDSAGIFTWTPSFDLVDRLEKEKKFTIHLEAFTDSLTARKSIDFTVVHVNRPPVVGELKNFYVQYNVVNTYQIDLNVVTDPDNDPVVFRQIPSTMPEGAQLTEKGVFTWKPSLRQFNRLRDEPITMSFIVEDQPAKAQVKGSFRILVTQMDLPPAITMIPHTSHVTAKENETINFKFFLSDPNGDDDIVNFDLVSEDLRITQKLLTQNSKTQWEFVWVPGYDFVKDGFDSTSLEVTFFVVDKSYQRDEKKVKITVLNTQDQEKIDRLYYSQYKGALTRIWDLLVQLSEKEKEYYKKLRQSRKGKTRLAITDASLGAITAVSPLMIEDQKDKQMVTGIGGATVMTIGTLEAAEVISKSPNEIIQNLNKIIEKKNELLMHGNVFARRYSTVLSRREKDFQKDMETLMSRLIMKDMATLELDASWKNPKKPTNEALMDYFPDFVADENL